MMNFTEAKDKMVFVGPGASGTLRHISSLRGQNACYDDGVSHSVQNVPIKPVQFQVDSVKGFEAKRISPAVYVSGF
jgi:hypothetical protein